ncbi:MAG: hypothetical protein ACOX6I_07845 [Syntrophomonadaceae bacterium]|jgi:hypothetical protein
MREYWQLELYVNDCRKTRYFYGTEAAARRRTKRYTADKKELIKLSRPHAQYLKKEKKVHIIDL